jgi:hypothetical protein
MLNNHRVFPVFLYFYNSEKKRGPCFSSSQTVWTFIFEANSPEIKFAIPQYETFFTPPLQWCYHFCTQIKLPLISSVIMIMKFFNAYGRPKSDIPLLLSRQYLWQITPQKIINQNHWISSHFPHPFSFLHPWRPIKHFYITFLHQRNYTPSLSICHAAFLFLALNFHISFYNPNTLFYLFQHP